MLRFAVRRMLSCVALLIAISILTFLIFEVAPDSNPALRLAGRTATADADHGGREDVGLQQAGLRAVRAGRWRRSSTAR